ncbi:hypothetical protein OB03_11735 [Brevundimonas sp. GN22]
MRVVSQSSIITKSKKAGKHLVPALDMALAIDREEALEIAQREARIRSKLAAAQSGNVHVEPRNSVHQDAAIFQEIRDSLKAGASIKLTTKQGRGVIKREALYIKDWKKIRAEDRKANRQHRDLNDWVKTMWMPHWDHTGDRLKALAWCLAMNEQGARTMTLRLGTEVIEAGLADPKGLSTHLLRRINRHLKKAANDLDLPVPEHFFMVEASDLGEVHIHGAILLPSNAKAYKAFRQALIAAGGEWRGGGSARQLDTQALQTPVRWTGYINKWRLGSALKIQGKAFAATHGVRRMGKDWYKRATANNAVLRPGQNYTDFGLTPIG